MSVILGSGEYTFRGEDVWPKLPEDIVLGDVSAVAVDRRDRVYLFNRGPHPMVVVSTEGELLATWGEGVFRNPHGLHIGPDDCIYCTDDGDHTVRKCTLDGKVLLTLGVPGSPSPAMSGRPFNRCTHTALSPDGDLYVSDGYGNASVHKFAPDGRRILSWGEPGIEPGQFNFPHNICCDADGWVYVADRENHRIQIFDGDGRYETQLNNFHRPSALLLTPGRCPLCYIGEIAPYMSVNRDRPNLGPRITIVTHDGKVLARLATTPAAGNGPGQFTSPHGLALDSTGSLYVGEVASRAWPSLFPGQPVPSDLRRVRKLTRISGEDAPGAPLRR